MGQDGFIAFALLFAFVVYVTRKGELPTYLSLLWGTSPAISCGGTAGPMPGNPSAMTVPPNNYSSYGAIPMQEF